MNTPRRSYFVMIPKIVLERVEDAYAVRLYAHIRDVAGEEGACWQSVRTLADACHMSAGKVTACKRILVEAGLIHIEKRRGPGSAYDWITVTDIWARNHAHYVAGKPDAANPHVDEAGAALPEPDTPDVDGDGAAGGDGDGRAQTPLPPDGAAHAKARSRGDPRRRDETQRSRDGAQRSRDETQRSSHDGQGSRGAIARSSGEPKKTSPESEPSQPDIEEDPILALKQRQQRRFAGQPPEAATWAVVVEGLKGMMLPVDHRRLFLSTRMIGIAADGAWRVAVPGPDVLQAVERPRNRVLLARGLRYAGIPEVVVRYEVRGGGMENEE